MALIKVEALAGYLLEEALAQLLRHNGYRLLSTADEDPFALREAGHGLLVRGRGADHQADALGELLMPSPFSLPVRLFVEGKNRGAKVSLAEVRNAHGTISDVNEHYSSQLAGAKSRPQRRYQYRYALFSAKGFKADAQGYALAQQISLIDLSGPAFQPLVATVNGAARSVSPPVGTIEGTNYRRWGDDERAAVLHRARAPRRVVRLVQDSPSAAHLPTSVSAAPIRRLALLPPPSLAVGG
jgi:hypothetical protein